MPDATQVPQITMIEADRMKITLGRVTVPRNCTSNPDLLSSVIPSESILDFGIKDYFKKFKAWFQTNAAYRPTPDEIQARIDDFFSPNSLTKMLETHYASITEFILKFANDRVDTETSVLLIGGASRCVGVDRAIRNIFPATATTTATAKCKEYYNRGRESAVVKGAFVPSQAPDALEISTSMTTQLGIMVHDNKAKNWGANLLFKKDDMLPKSTTSNEYITHEMKKATGSSSGRQRSSGGTLPIRSTMEVTLIEGDFEPESVYDTRHPTSAKFSTYSVVVESTLEARNKRPLTIKVDRDADQAVHLSIQIEGDEERKVFIHLDKQGAGRRKVEPPVAVAAAATVAGAVAGATGSTAQQGS
jgi:hypothetical protein